MQSNKLKTILHDILIDLPFYEGTINQVSVLKCNNSDKYWTLIDNQDNTNIFDYDKLYLKIRKIKNGKIACYDSTIKIAIPKNHENLFKTIINSLLAYLKGRDLYNYKSEGKETKLRQEFMEAFQVKNANYFNNNFVYATTYGLGYYCLLMTEAEFNNVNAKLGKFLGDNKIDYKNEFSDKCWVYRFKFKSLKEDNIKLVNKLILI